MFVFNNKLTIKLFLIVCFISLFLNFRTNCFHIVEPKWFNNHQLDSESLVVAKILDARTNGVFVSYGLGRYADGKDLWRTWFDYTNAYTNNKDININIKFQPYLSQVGLQGYTFSLLDKVIPFPEKAKLSLFYNLNSFLLALALTYIFAWFIKEFNLFTGGFLLLSTILSPWVTVFGKNLYWVAWTWFLPMILSIIILEYADQKKKFPMAYAVLSTICVIMIKCLCGCEFISTILIAMMIPYIYYSLSRKWLKKDFIVRFGAISLAGLLGFVIAIAIHIIMLHSFFGDWRVAIQTFEVTVIRRTYADPTLLSISNIDKESLVAPISIVLDRYFNGGLQYDWLLDKGYFMDLSKYFYTPTNFLKIAYQELIFIFIIFSMACLVSEKYVPAMGKWRNKIISLVISTWISILAPLSWFILAKAHSYVHVHINYVLWHVPFCLFAFAAVGVIISCVLENISFRNKLIVAAICLLILTFTVVSQNQWLFGKTMPVDLSDENWENGISITDNYVLFRDFRTNRKLIETSKYISFKGNDKRKITKIEVDSGQWIRVYYEGNQVDPIKGYPCFVEFENLSS